MLSIIAANHNKEEVLDEFFQSIYSNGFSDFEMLFVDDCSTDLSLEIAEKYPCRIIRNQTNIGPAASRNLAAKKALGDILVFTDTDITIDPGGLQLIADRFRDGARALFGKLEFPPLRNTAVGRYWLFEEDEVCHYGGVRTGEVNCWSSTLGAVEKDLFDRIGGFSEDFKGADIEDHELAARILDEVPVFYDEALTFHHYYPSAVLVLRKTFRRSAMFAVSRSIRVYRDRSWVSTHRSAGYALSAALTITLSATVLSAFVIPRFSIYALSASSVIAFLFALHHRYMIGKVLKKENFLFLMYCLLMLYLNSLFAMAGFAMGRLRGSGS